MHKIIPGILILCGMILSCSLEKDGDPSEGAAPSTTNTNVILSGLHPGNFTSYPIELAGNEYKIIYIPEHTGAVDNSPGWWQDAVIYQLFVRSFMDSDNNNTGDLNGLISKLDYLTNIGFNGIWMLPVFSSPSIHGYDATDYYSIESDYGNMTQFENLVTQSHNRGIKLQLDLVVNHSSDQHIWFTDSAAKQNGKDDWYVWTNTGTNLTGWGTPWDGSGTYANVWHVNGTRTSDYYYGAFWGGMPDLNLTYQPVLNEISNIIHFWLNKNIDGYRMDAVRYFVEDGAYPEQKDSAGTLTALRHMHDYVKGYGAAYNTVGEAWTETSAETAAYYDNGNGLDQAFLFHFTYAIPGILNSQNKSTMTTLINNIKSYSAPLSFYATFLDNHDNPLNNDNRIMDVLGTNFNKMEMALAIQMTFIGTPYVYYGTEIGMKTRDHASGDTAKRTPMHWDDTAYGGFSTFSTWTGMGDNSDPFNVAAQSGDPDSLLERTKWLIKLRKEYDGLRRGDIKIIDNDKLSVLSYARPGTGGTILLVANLSPSAQTVNLDFTGSGLSSVSNYTMEELSSSGGTNTSSSNTNTGYLSVNSSMYLRGTFNGWTTNTPMSLVSDYTWDILISITNGYHQYKFDASGSWTTGQNWGVSATPWLAEANGGNISYTNTGTFTVRFNDQTLNYTNF